MMSAPASRYWGVDLADHLGPGEREQVVVAFSSRVDEAKRAPRKSLSERR